MAWGPRESQSPKAQVVTLLDGRPGSRSATSGPPVTLEPAGSVDLFLLPPFSAPTSQPQVEAPRSGKLPMKAYYHVQMCVCVCVCVCAGGLIPCILPDKGLCQPSPGVKFDGGHLNNKAVLGL